jgi:hypothetical protein
MNAEWNPGIGMIVNLIEIIENNSSNTLCTAVILYDL